MIAAGPRRVRFGRLVHLDGGESGAVGATVAVESAVSGYGRPDGALGGYARVVAGYGVGVGVAGAVLRLAGRPLPSLSVGDVLLFGVATHHVAHIVAKEPVASPLRAPFTRFVGPEGP